MARQPAGARGAAAPAARPENAGGSGVLAAAWLTTLGLGGDYEEAASELIEKMVRRGTRVLECGGRAGITGSLAALAVRKKFR